MSKQEQLSSVHLPWFGIPRIARYFKPYRSMIAVSTISSKLRKLTPPR